MFIIIAIYSKYDGDDGARDAHPGGSGGRGRGEGGGREDDRLKPAHLHRSNSINPN